MAKDRIPVLLLTGYLGSGKTTLVNRILSNRKGIRFAVIVNDIGEVNIDADLIQKGGVVGQGDESLVALQNGCICCTLKMDLVAQLSDLAHSGRFDYIVIEASGICEPAPIAQTICAIPQIGPEYVMDCLPYLDCIVTVVDALRMQSEFDCGEKLEKDDIADEDIENLVIQQIEFCNIVVLNKASEVSPEDLGRVRRIVRALQPSARIIECDYGDVDFDSILDTGLFDFDKVATSAAWIDAIENGTDLEHDGDHDGDDDPHHGHHDDDGDGPGEGHHGEHDDDDRGHGSHHHHHHDHDHEGEGHLEEYGIGTFVYYRRPALNMNMFDRFVSRLWPRSIIRAKGVCWFSDDPDRCYLFEQAGVQKSIKDAGMWYATMPQDQLNMMMLKEPALRRDWDEEYGDRMVKIVFIGQNMDRKAIEEELDKCLEAPLWM